MFKKLLISAALILVTLLMGTSIARAVEFNNSGNGTGSQNSINFQNSNTTNIQQNNQGSVNNNVDANANTGGNSGGSIKTGDATTEVNINNNLNNNSATVKCCDGKTAPLPPPPSNGGKNNPPGSSNDPGPSGGSSSNSNPAILGLSATAGPENEQYVFYALSLLCVGVGSKLLLKKQS